MAEVAPDDFVRFGVPSVGDGWEGGRSPTGPKSAQKCETHPASSAPTTSKAGGSVKWMAMGKTSNGPQKPGNSKSSKVERFE